MFEATIVGYKKITKEGRVMFLLFAEGEEVYTDNTFGKQVYTSFIHGEALEKMRVTEKDLLGSIGQFISVKTDNGYKTVVAFINA